MKSWAVTVLLLTCLTARAETGRSIVHGKRPKHIQTHDHIDLATKPLDPFKSEDALRDLSGVAVTHTAGPLSPSTLQIRGLSGPRISMDLDGLVLGDTDTGWIDVAGLSLFPFLVAQVEGGQLSLKFKDVLETHINSELSIGSLSSQSLRTSLETPLGKSTDLVIGLSAASTQGNFLYSWNGSSPMIRLNSDQHRLNTLAHLQSRLDSTWKLNALLLAQHNEGGIPGFVFAPTEGLRGASSSLALMLKTSADTCLGKIDLNAQSRFQSRSTYLPPRDQYSNISMASHRIGAKLPYVSSYFEFSQIFDKPFQRVTCSGDIHAEQAQFKERVSVEFDSDLGAMWSGRLAWQVAIDSAFSLGASLTRTARPPTLSEMFAPEGLVSGNAHLKPESGYDAETFVEYKIRNLFRIRLSPFVGFLQQAILYVNQSAFEIKPINTGGILRVGLDGKTSWDPHRLLSLSATAQLISTRIIETQEAMPGVPWLNVNANLRVGDVDWLSGWINVYYRSSVTNNIFGSLVSQPYTLVDASARWAVNPALSLSLNVTNVFNVLTACDAHQMPLPGRLFFVSVALAS